jgi:hypothetical protein
MLHYLGLSKRSDYVALSPPNDPIRVPLAQFQEHPILVVTKMFLPFFF